MAKATQFTAARAETTSIAASDLGLLVLRLALGAIFIAHGAQKLFGWFGGYGLEGTVEGFGSMGISPVLAYLAIFTEFFGGIALVLGVLTRLAALGLAVTMLVALLKVHLANGFFLTSGAPPYTSIGYEYNLALLAMALTLVFTGPGRIAIGDVERRFFAK